MHHRSQLTAHWQYKTYIIILKNQTSQQPILSDSLELFQNCFWSLTFYRFSAMLLFLWVCFTDLSHYFMLHRFNMTSSSYSYQTGDLATAIRAKTDIHFGIYHSLFEWFNPEYMQDAKNNYTTQTFVAVSPFPCTVLSDWSVSSECRG